MSEEGTILGNPWEKVLEALTSDAPPLRVSSEDEDE